MKASARLMPVLRAVLIPAAAAMMAALGLAPGPAPAAPAEDAAALKATATRLGPALAASPFHRPLLLESSQADSDLRGDVFAIVDRSFGALAPALQTTAQWCDLLILHLNVKSCRPGAARSAETIALVVGRKVEQSLSDAYPIDFRYRVDAATTDYLHVQMNSPKGPLGTTDYRLAFEAVPLDASRSFVHLAYAYTYGLAARVATNTYLSTLGRGKVGFSVVSKTAAGEPVYVDGLRAVLERNTMRYYLAIQAYLDALGAPPAEQAEKRLQEWFAATERYALQLHEVESADYFAMKHNELRRQQSPEGARD